MPRSTSVLPTWLAVRSRDDLGMEAAASGCLLICDADDVIDVRRTSSYSGLCRFALQYPRTATAVAASTRMRLSCFGAWSTQNYYHRLLVQNS